MNFNIFHLDDWKKEAFPAAGLPKATARRAAFPKEKPCARVVGDAPGPSEAGWRAYAMNDKTKATSHGERALARYARSAYI